MVFIVGFLHDAVIFLLAVLWIFLVGLCRFLWHWARGYSTDPPLGTAALWFLIPVQWAARGLLLLFGVWWIEERRPPNVTGCSVASYLQHAGGPRVVAGKHTSFLDGIYFVSRCIPILVAKEPLRHIPVVGTMLNILQPLWVSRQRRSSLSTAPNPLLHDMRRVAVERSETPRRPLVIFPEGSVGNQEALLQFRQGVFSLGIPVTMAAISYPFQTFDVSWTAECPALWLLFRLLCQGYTRMRVELLPPLVPSEEERQRPIVFAERAQRAMASHMGLHVTTWTNADAILLKLARKFQGKQLLDFVLAALLGPKRFRTNALVRRAGGDNAPLLPLLNIAQRAWDRPRPYVNETMFAGVLGGLLPEAVAGLSHSIAAAWVTRGRTDAVPPDEASDEDDQALRTRQLSRRVPVVHWLQVALGAKPDRDAIESDRRRRARVQFVATVMEAVAVVERQEASMRRALLVFLGDGQGSAGSVGLPEPEGFEMLASPNAEAMGPDQPLPGYGPAHVVPMAGAYHRRAVGSYESLERDDSGNVSELVAAAEAGRFMDELRDAAAAIEPSTNQLAAGATSSSGNNHSNSNHNSDAEADATTGGGAPRVPRRSTDGSSPWVDFVSSLVAYQSGEPASQSDPSVWNESLWPFHEVERLHFLEGVAWTWVRIWLGVPCEMGWWFRPPPRTQPPPVVVEPPSRHLDGAGDGGALGGGEVDDQDGGGSDPTPVTVSHITGAGSGALVRDSSLAGSPTPGSGRLRGKQSFDVVSPVSAPRKTSQAPERENRAEGIHSEQGKGRQTRKEGQSEEDNAETGKEKGTEKEKETGKGACAAGPGIYRGGAPRQPSSSPPLPPRPQTASQERRKSTEGALAGRSKHPLPVAFSEDPGSSSGSHKPPGVKVEAEEEEEEAIDHAERAVAAETGRGQGETHSRNRPVLPRLNVPGNAGFDGSGREEAQLDGSIMSWVTPVSNTHHYGGGASVAKSDLSARSPSEPSDASPKRGYVSPSSNAGSLSVSVATRQGERRDHF